MRLTLAIIAALFVATACASSALKHYDAHIRPHSDALSLCYIQVLRTDPTAQGEIELAVTLDGTGKVIATELVKNTFPDDRVGKCVAGVLAGIVFPADGQNRTVTFNYPVIFTAEPPVK